MAQLPPQLVLHDTLLQVLLALLVPGQGLNGLSDLLRPDAVQRLLAHGGVGTQHSRSHAGVHALLPLVCSGHPKAGPLGYASHAQVIQDGVGLVEGLLRFVPKRQPGGLFFLSE